MSRRESSQGDKRNGDCMRISKGGEVGRRRKSDLWKNAENSLSSHPIHPRVCIGDKGVRVPRVGLLVWFVTAGCRLSNSRFEWKSREHMLYLLFIRYHGRKRRKRICKSRSSKTCKRDGEHLWDCVGLNQALGIHGCSSTGRRSFSTVASKDQN